jgi:hypothetical protein
MLPLLLPLLPLLLQLLHQHLLLLLLPTPACVLLLRALLQLRPASCRLALRNLGVPRHRGHLPNVPRARRRMQIRLPALA